MKKNNLHSISYRALLIAAGLLLGVHAANAASDRAEDPTCGDYDYSVAVVRGGTITATFDVSTCIWTIEAVPTADFAFSEWSDHNTDNPRTIDFNNEVDLEDDEFSFTAIFVMQITNCKTIGDYDYNVKTNTGGTITCELVDGEQILTAIPNAGYVFAQWADGNAANPRTITDYLDDEVTYYAAFIPTATRGKIDSWDEEGFYVTTSEGNGAIDEGYVTIFMDGQSVNCGPAGDEDYVIEIDKGVYYMYAAYSTELAGKLCHVVYKNDSHEPTATLDTILPVLVSSDQIVEVPNSSTGVHIINGATATFATDQTIADLDVYAGGTAVVEGNLNVSSVTLHGDAINQADPASLLVTGTLSNSNDNKIYYDYKLDYAAYYPFSLPYTVNTKNVTYRSGNDASEHFVIGQYFSAKRAAGANGWDYQNPYYDIAGDPTYGIKSTSHKDITPGVGYNIYAEAESWNGIPQDQMYGGNIRFPMTVDLSTSGENGKSVDVHMYEGDKPYRNWNLLSLPYLSAYNGELWLCKGSDQVRKLRYVTIPLGDFDDCQAELVENATLYPFQAFFVQFDNDIDVDKLSFESPNPSARAAAPRRKEAKQVETTNEIKAGITLSHAGKSDHTGLFIGDNYTSGYDVNADLAKMIGSRATRVKLYSIADSQKLAYIALPAANGVGTQETLIPLGYTNAAVNGEMTFAIDTKRYPDLRESEDIVALELVDNVDNKTVDLLESDYTCTAYQKSDNSRFALNVRYRAPQQQEIYTGICCDAPRATALPDGVYDLLGRPMQSSVLPAGAYIVVENGKTRKEVIR